jgi:hypothetical protein
VASAKIGRHESAGAAMKRNNLYLIIGLLAVAVVIVGYLYYREQQKTRLEIKVNDQGLSVETN